MTAALPGMAGTSAHAAWAAYGRTDLSMKGIGGNGLTRREAFSQVS